LVDVKAVGKEPTEESGCICKKRPARPRGARGSRFEMGTLKRTEMLVSGAAKLNAVWYRDLNLKTRRTLGHATISKLISRWNPIKSGLVLNDARGPLGGEKYVLDGTRRRISLNAKTQKKGKYWSNRKKEPGKI